VTFEPGQPYMFPVGDIGDSPSLYVNSAENLVELAREYATTEDNWYSDGDEDEDEDEDEGITDDYFDSDLNSPLYGRFYVVYGLDMDALSDIASNLDVFNDDETSEMFKNDIRKAGGLVYSIGNNTDFNSNLPDVEAKAKRTLLEMPDECLDWTKTQTKEELIKIFAQGDLETHIILTPTLEKLLSPTEFKAVLSMARLNRRSRLYFKPQGKHTGY